MPIHCWYKLNILAPLWEEKWSNLTEYHVERPTTGVFLKETGMHFWNDTNNGAPNISGFNALPLGRRFEEGRITGEIWFSGVGYQKNTLINTGFSDNCQMLFFSVRAYYLPQFGFSVRCVKD